MPLLRQVVSEPGASSPGEYAARVRRLAILYPLLTFGALVGEVLLGLRGKHLVSLTQRSNVETLTLAFFAVFFAYVGVLGARGVPGSLQLLRFWVLARLRGADAAERAKWDALGPPQEEGPIAALNLVVEREGAPGEKVVIPVADAAGPMSRIVIDGASVQNEPLRRDGSNNLIAYFARQLDELAAKPQGRTVDVVEWGTLDDEATHQFLAMAEFGRNLGVALGKPHLWPRVVLDDRALAELEARLAAVCPALRSEGFLPHWEYEAEHKLPIIPEPLGLASLGRTERRADPLPSLVALTAMVLTAVALLVVAILRPPWVPGS
ncbi:MAG TPA: hypothetical protein VEB43_08435 [Anaeromyxobacter sp.]|nr:hypothetical protein [Anaeromyxobacter sp.]